MSKRQITLVKSQNRKPILTKTQIVVSCVNNGSVEKTEKLQNKGTVKGLSLSTILTEENRTFLEERCNEGTLDDLVSLIRVVWDDYLVGKLITLVEQSTQAFQESPGANLRKNKPDRGITSGSNPFKHKDLLLQRQDGIIRMQKAQIFDKEQVLFEKDEQIAQLENELEEVCEKLFLEVNLL
jgi:hypothetical protein